MKPQAFIFIGRSGCGKGTQAELLAKVLAEKGVNNIYPVGTGKSFREFIKSESYSSNLSKVIMEHGARQPDFLAVWVWSHLLVENLKGGETLIFDGTPRSLNEARMLDTALDFYNFADCFVINLEISRDEAVKRLTLRGRGDDTSASNVTLRLDWFETDVVPAIEYYKSRGERYKFIDLDGEQTVEAIHAELLAKVGLA